jgi:hypothetical protein
MKMNNLTKLVKGVLVSVALVTTVVACGNKNKDNPNLNAYQQACSNCGDITGFPFFTAQTTAQSMTYGSYANAMKINWSFSGQNISQQQQNNQNNNGYSYGAPSMMYTGKVSAIGTVTVNSLLNLGMCPQIPPGNYQLATQTVGAWNGNGNQAQVSGIRLLMTRDNIQFTAILSNAYAAEYVGYGYGYASRTQISGNLQIEQVNGFYCNSASFYLY